MSDQYLTLVRTAEHTLEMWRALEKERYDQRKTIAPPTPTPAERRMAIAVNDLRIAVQPVARELSYGDVELPF